MMTSPTVVAPTTTRDERICETDVTVGHVELDLQTYFRTTNTISSFDAREIGQGKGFLSCTARLELTVGHGNGSPTILSGRRRTRRCPRRRS